MGGGNMDRELCIELINRLMSLMTDEQLRFLYGRANTIYCRGIGKKIPDREGGTA